jgi:hypothetical protein
MKEIGIKAEIVQLPLSDLGCGDQKASSFVGGGLVIRVAAASAISPAHISTDDRERHPVHRRARLPEGATPKAAAQGIGPGVQRPGVELPGRAAQGIGARAAEGVAAAIGRPPAQRVPIPLLGQQGTAQAQQQQGDRQANQLCSARPFHGRPPYCGHS